MKNCQFDGEMLLRGNNTVYTGGMIGYVKTTKGKVNIEHCLFSGEMISEQTMGTLDVGGFIGVTISKSRVEMVDCLSAGTMKTDWSRNIGSIIGSHTGSILKMEHVYADLSCYNATIGLASTAVNSYPLEFVSDCFIGENALKWTELDFEKYWTIVEDGAPTLRTFAETQVEASNAEKAYSTGWYNPQEDTYTLNTLEDFYGFYVLSAQNTFDGKTIKLGADIKVNEGKVADWKKEAPNTPWYPIKKFAGTFDGQGHTISGVYLQTAQRTSGLFTETSATAILKNFKLTNSYFESVGDGIAIIGSVVGVADGTLDTIYSDAVVVADALIFGGIAGNVISTQRATITNCWYDGEILVGDGGGYVGGITGQVENSSHARIMHCLNSGNITATKEKGSMTLGGIVGVISDDRTKVAVSDTLNVGVVSTPAKSGIGSIFSTVLQKTTISLENCYATEESCANSYASKHGTLEGSCFRKKAVDLSGYNAYEWTFLDFEKYWAVVKNGTPILQSFAESVPSLAGHERKISIDWYKEKDTTYTLKTAKDLYGFYHMSHLTNFEGKTVRLGKDITVNQGNAADWQNKAPSSVWYSIRNFAGTFDGRGHTISGIYLKTDLQGRGLFAEVTPKTVIKNFRLTNSYFEGTHEKAAQIGSVVGKGQGRIEGVYSNAIIVADTLIAGGIIGDISSKEKVIVSNCWYDGIMKIGSKGGYIGGITGEVQDGTVAEIQHCLNTGTITGAKEKGSITMGGIVGVIADDNTKVTISDTLNAGIVSAPSNAGIGSIFSTVLQKTTLILDNCYATEESCANSYASKHGTLVGACYRKSTVDMSGYMAYEWTLLDFAKYWAVVEGGTPILKSFATNVPSVAGYERRINIDWYNENAKEYVLQTANDLYGFYHLSNATDFAGKTVKLGADITVNQGNAADWQNAAPSATWYAIRNFAGTFDGQGHTISGIYMKTDLQGRGLFAETTPKTVIKNFKLTNSYFESTSTKPSMMGSVVGKGQGTFDTIYSDAIVVSNALICGGIIGDISSKEKVVVTNCWYDGTMKMGDKGGYVGGITGEVQDGTQVEITHCLNTGNITGTNAKSSMTMGGIVGVLSDKGTVVTVKDTLGAGKVSCPSKGGIGSIASTILQDTVLNLENCYATKESSVRAIHRTHGKTNGICYEMGADSISGQGGYRWTYLDFKDYWTVSEETPVLHSFVTKVAGEGKKVNVDWYKEDKKELRINSIEELFGMFYLSYDTDFSGKTIILEQDIDLTGYQWNPIAKFAGTFDGKGSDGKIHSIKNFKMTQPGVDNVAFFAATTNTAVVKNLQLTDCEISGNKTVAAIAGVAQGTFKNISVSGTINGTGTQNAGMFGAVKTDEGKTTRIENCQFVGSVESTSTDGYTGGMIGYLRESAKAKNIIIRNCSVIGPVKGAGSYVGGFCGYVDKNTPILMENCFSASTVTGKSYAGGIIGMNAGDTATTTGTIMNNVYTTATKAVGYGRLKAGSGNVLADTSLQGNNAFVNTMLNFEADWTVTDSYPKLRVFVPEAEEQAIPTGLNRVIPENGDITWKSIYEGTEEDPYILKDAADLVGLAKQTKSAGGYQNFAGKYFILANDITVNYDNEVETNRLSWPIIGVIGASSAPQYSFKGCFDGNGYTISGIYYKTSNDANRNVGLFSRIPVGATVKNLRMENSYIESTRHVGAIAGWVDGGTYQNVHIGDTVTVKAKHTVGGMLGCLAAAANTSIKKCQSDAQVVSTTTSTADYSYAGGMIGKVTTSSVSGAVLSTISIEECVVGATVDAKREYSGGFCGHIAYHQVNFLNSIFKGTVTTTQRRIGGFVGVVDGGKVSMEYCLSAGTLDASAYTSWNPCIGGFVGHVLATGGLNVKQSLYVGTMEANWDNSEIITYGPIIGYSETTNSTAIVVSDTYATLYGSGNNQTMDFTKVNAIDIKGDSAKTKMPKLHWSTHWICVKDDYPTLKALNSETK